MANHETPLPLPDRRSIRLKGFDYTRNGAYFITICTRDRLCLFGHVAEGRIDLTPIGRVVLQCWDELPAHHARVELDAFQIMPNHVHGVVWLTFEPARAGVRPESAVDPAPGRRPAGPTAGSIAAVVGSFKSAVSRKVNQSRGGSGASVWQRDYFEHVIRDERSLALIREYVVTNPHRWGSDKENPGGNGADDVEAWVRTLADEPPVRTGNAVERGFAGARPASPVPVGAAPGVRATQASPLRGSTQPVAGAAPAGVRATRASPLRGATQPEAGAAPAGVRATQASPLRGATQPEAGAAPAGVRATRASPLRGSAYPEAGAVPAGVRATQASPLRIGHGYDLHRLQPGGTLTLGGLAVADGLSPVAHSDGDVVLHALVDALLGAMGWGDIGDHFPNDDPQWENAPSRVFVAAVYDKVRAAGYVVQNLDVTILAERPRLKAFKKPMAEYVAGLIHVAPDQVNVKAGTNEGCDAIGRGEAIAAHAVLLLGRAD